MTAEQIAQQFVDLTTAEADARPVADREWIVDEYGRVGASNAVWWLTTDLTIRDHLRLHEYADLTFRCSGEVGIHRITRVK